MALYAMKEILCDAREKGYGVGYFNAVDMEMVRAYIAAAEECRSPIIIGTAEALLRYSDMDWIVPLMLEQARRASVPVAVHLDHTYKFELIMKALRAGFGSVMFDGSRLADHGENIRISAEIARVAHAMGVGLECELGSIGGLSDESGRSDSEIYTDPDDARDFIEKTGADFLAVSIGTQHGVYKAEPKLDIPRLRKIRDTVDIPLVMHGGSGLSDEDFRRTIEGGIRKINVYTDILLAARDATARNLDKSYNEITLAAEQAMKDATVKKIMLFGSAGRA